MISNILRWSAKTLLVLLLLAVAAIAGFRLAASFRETADRDALAPPSGHLVQTSSGGVFMQEKGPPDGVPVVLFHGTAAWSELWWRTSDALAASGFHVIALDLPPFGFSDRPGTYTRGDQAARINDVLGALKAPPAIIVGRLPQRSDALPPGTRSKPPTRPTTNIAVPAAPAESWRRFVTRSGNSASSPPKPIWINRARLAVIASTRTTSRLALTRSWSATSTSRWSARW